MKLIIPNNIFATLFILEMNKTSNPEIEVKEASLIVHELLDDEDKIGLIPSFDLIKHKELFISSKFGIGFESFLSNSFLYFNDPNKKIDEILLRGDISTNEVILAKLVFQERYNINPEFSLDTDHDIKEDKNYLITGSENWVDDRYMKGTGFCEQVSELVEAPYLNFVFASKSQSAIKKFNEKYNHMNEAIRIGLEDNLTKIGLSELVNNFIKHEIDSVYFDLGSSEIDALNELFQLAYFHQIFDELFDLKIV